jgi:hypothetical protein
MRQVAYFIADIALHFINPATTKTVLLQFRQNGIIE